MKSNEKMEFRISNLNKMCREIESDEDANRVVTYCGGMLQDLYVIGDYKLLDDEVIKGYQKGIESIREDALNKYLKYLKGGH